MLEKLIEMSNKYGQDPEYVLAGGGNTSYKDDTTLYVKGSGTALATITADGFVAMDRKKLSEIFEKEYPDDDQLREAAVLEDMLASRLPGNEHKRPSVEAALHNLMDFSYILHVHPALVNGITCAKDGKKTADALFGGKYIWIPLCKPGYTLAALCKQELERFAQQHGQRCSVIILQNHGIFFGADGTEEMDRLVLRVMNAIKQKTKHEYDFSPAVYDAQKAGRAVEEIRCIGGDDAAYTEFICNGSVLKLVQDQRSFAPLAAPFSPDHIVYCKAKFLFADCEHLKEDYAAFKKREGYAPRVIALAGLGVVIACGSEKDLQNAQMLFFDAVKIAEYAQNFGGENPLPADFVDFIANWEVEAYRSKVAQ